MKNKISGALSALFLLTSSSVFAAAYELPSSNDVLIGEIQYTTVDAGDTVSSIAMRFDVGYNAIESANPHVDTSKSLPYGSPIKVTTQHVLPNLPREGIVINLPEMRMYYYPAGSGQVLTYPIGIGKIGKTIPITKTSISKKAENPVWVPPADIREYNLKQGIVLPRIMPPGPDNPLGPYAIYTRIPTYLIHSTIFPESVGKRASFGCIRMYESDIQDFFPSVNGGIPVVIINSPTKVGWQQDRLYLEAYEPLKEHSNATGSTLASMVQQVSDASKDMSTLVDWQMISYIAEARDGVPHEIGISIQ